MGMATTREEERQLAPTGEQDYAESVFDHNESVLNAGVLLAIPALISQGLERFCNVFKPLPSGFYGLHHMVLTMCFMALSRIKNPEQLKSHAPGEFGKLLGLDRVPEVGHFRTKLKQITQQVKSDELHKELFHKWMGELPEYFLYIDGHVRVYHGKKANLPKRYVSREQLCLSGTTEFWLNNEQGLPLMVITGEVNEKLKASIEEAIPEILKEVPSPPDKNTPVFTLIFDREAYEPAWFQKLWDEHQIAIISYRKNVQDKWDENLFKYHEVQVINNNVEMQLCESSVELSGYDFREIRKLCDDGHQVSIITTHPGLCIEEIAGRMFSRWVQENFFKYMDENFDLDKMIEYGTQSVNPEYDIPNPEYQRLSQQLKKERERKSRIEAKVLQKLEANEQDITIEEALAKVANSSDLIRQLRETENKINELLSQREQHSSRVTVKDMPEEKRYNKLKTEGKKLKNAVIMVAYRAETALLNYIKHYYKNSGKDGRALLREIFTSNADIMPDYANNTLTVKLHALSTPRATQAAQKLCELLNETETIYPHTDLKLVYKTMAD